MKKFFSLFIVFCLSIASAFACGECWENNVYNHSHWFDNDGNLHIIVDNYDYDYHRYTAEEHIAEYWRRDERFPNMIWLGYRYESHGLEQYSVFYIWENEGFSFYQDGMMYKTKNTYFERYGAPTSYLLDELGWEGLFKQDTEWLRALNAYANYGFIPHDLFGMLK